jgi:hypothetical protein
VKYDGKSELKGRLNMKRISVFVFLSAFIAVAFILSVLPKLVVSQEEMVFGGEEDIQFAKELWKSMGDYKTWLIKSKPIPGSRPHGKIVQLYYNIVTVNQMPYHVIVKDNFRGEEATVETVSKERDKYLDTITIMVQREEGYDRDNNNWYWVAYKPNGSVKENGAGVEGVKLAGRVAKGMKSGCIACHKTAKGNDYLFTNDKK